MFYFVVECFIDGDDDAYIALSDVCFVYACCDDIGENGGADFFWHEFDVGLLFAYGGEVVFGFNGHLGFVGEFVGIGYTMKDVIE